jgi:hypothetical protein
MGWIKNTIKEKMKRAEEQAFFQGGYISYDPNEEVEAAVAQSNFHNQMAELYKRDPKAYADIMKSDLVRNAVISTSGIGNSVLGGPSTWPPFPTTQAQPQHSAIEKIAMRMRWPSQYHVPENVTIVQAYEVGHANAYVFIIFKDGKTVTLEDEAGLFPSDKLITELRVLGL